MKHLRTDTKLASLSSCKVLLLLMEPTHQQVCFTLVHSSKLNVLKLTINEIYLEHSFGLNDDFCFIECYINTSTAAHVCLLLNWPTKLWGRSFYGDMYLLVSMASDNLSRLGKVKTVRQFECHTFSLPSIFIVSFFFEHNYSYFSSWLPKGLLKNLKSITNQLNK